jgi:hypothetical protein
MLTQIEKFLSQIDFVVRNKFCVKQVSNLNQNLCGHTQYFGDRFVGSTCEFKKCSATCHPGTEEFEYDGTTYTRTTYCCKGDYCNSGVKSILTLLFVMIIVFVQIIMQSFLFE